MSRMELLQMVTKRRYIPHHLPVSDLKTFDTIELYHIYETSRLGQYKEVHALIWARAM